MSKVYNRSKQLVEPAQRVKCPRCRGFGANLGDNGVVHYATPMVKCGKVSLDGSDKSMGGYMTMTKSNCFYLAGNMKQRFTKERFNAFYRLIRIHKGYTNFFRELTLPEAKRLLWLANRVYLSCH